MLARLIDWSLEHRFLVLLLAGGLIGSGLVSLSRLPLDAFPDTTPVMVQVHALAPALGPEALEQQVTFPIEQALSGVPNVTELRSLTRYGLSQVTVVFDEHSDLYQARQQVHERASMVELPEGVEGPTLGPVATGIGEVYHYSLSSKTRSLQQLTELHEWVIKPRLLSVPGVAEVNTWGGEHKQYQVRVDPQRLVKYGLVLEDVANALRANNRTAGGGWVAQAGESQIVQGLALVHSVADVEQVVVSTVEGVPLRVRDIADVAIGHEIRRGAVTENGKGEVVLGLAMMLIGENSHALTKRLKQRMAEIQPFLPKDVELRVLYDRTELVNQVIETVRRNLLEGALLVIAVLFVFLGNLRAGLIVASAIPLSMLFSFNAMLQFGIAASLMSLGAIDFGLVVDSAVIMVENTLHRLNTAPPGLAAREIVRQAALEVRKPTMFGELIIALVYLPILALEGVEGRLFRPMALTVLFALASSMVLSLTLMPVLASLLLRPAARQRVNPLMWAAQALYRPVLRLSLHLRWLVLCLALGLMVFGGWVALQLGSAFVPRLSEMSIVINTIRLSGVSLDESIRYGLQLERLIREKYPDEVRDVWSRIGTAEVATDPMGIELTDMYLMLHPREQWKRARTQEELVTRMEADLAGMPGMRMVFTQPIELRLNEMVAGSRSDVAVKLFGDDLELLKALARSIEGALRALPGAADVVTEQLTGQPVLQVEINRMAAARHGVSAEQILNWIEAVGGIDVGEVREGQRGFPLVIRLDPQLARNAASLSQLLVPTATGGRIPLGELAVLREIEGPATLNREWQRRRIVVQCNVRGRDLGGFVHEARERIRKEVVLPPGYYVAFGGQFEHLERAGRRLAIVVPLALLLIVVLLYFSTGSARDTCVIFTGAPFATLGGLLALWWSGLPFTISAAVGFIAVWGVVMLNGLVLVSTIQQSRAEGLALREAIEQATLLRLRPVLMTALVASLGFVPMIANHGVGAEVQRPLALVVVAGIVSATLLTLIVLPALYLVAGGTAGPSRRQL